MPYLMVCNHDDALGKVELDSPVGCGFDLPCDRRISADTDHRGSPDLGHDGGGEGKGTLGHGHIGVVPVPVDEIQRRSNDLGDIDTA